MPESNGEFAPDRVSLRDHMNHVGENLEKIASTSENSRTPIDSHPKPPTDDAITSATQRLHAATDRLRQHVDTQDERRFDEVRNELQVAGLFEGITSVPRTEPIQVKSHEALPTVASASPDHVAAVEDYVASFEIKPLESTTADVNGDVATIEPPVQPVTRLEPEPFRTEGGRHMTEAQNNTLPSYLSEPSAFRPTSEERKAAEDLVDQFAPGPVSKTFFDPGEKGPGIQLGRKLFSFSERISNAFSSLKNRLTPKRMPPPKPA